MRLNQWGGNMNEIVKVSSFSKKELVKSSVLKSLFGKPTVKENALIELNNLLVDHEPSQMIAINRNIFKAIILLPLLFYIGCQSVKKDTYYEDKLTKERVLVVFSGSEKTLIARYGQKFKYQYDPQDSPFVVFTGKRDYNAESFSDLKILSEKVFLKSYTLIE
jgi:hypothetical protein